MPTPRKKPTAPGFSAKKVEELKEQDEVQEFLDAIAEEMFETISQAEEELTPSAPVFVPQDIVPTDDVGPRFVEPIPEPTSVTEENTPIPLNVTPPRRHPRNVPKFSRYK